MTNKVFSMARNVHWKVSFRTRSERLGVLNLYEEDYTGEVVELTPAAVPFETQEDSADTWFVPIRKQTGYIRVLDEGNTEGIMPVGMKDRYVEYTEDGSLKWCGYMVPDVFSSDWDVTPLEVEFPVVGGLGVLEGEYLNEDDGLGVVPLAKLLYDALKATGVDYSMIYFPKEVLQSASATDYLFPMRLEVSRFNFFAENDSLNSEDSDWLRYNGSTHYEVLSELMSFWGWTIRERGDQVWITSTVNTGSVWITFSELEMLVRGSSSVNGTRSADMNQYELSSFGLAGADHKRDILQGRKKVVVKAGVNPVGAVVPSVDKAKMKFVDTFVKSFYSGSPESGNAYAYEKESLYVPKDGYTDVVFRSYAKATITDFFEDWTSVPQTLTGVSLYLGAYFIAQERVSAEEYRKKKNWNLTDTIRINLQDWTGSYPTIEEARNLPIVQMRSRKVASYQNGAFVIGAQTRSATQHLESDYDGNGKGALELMFRVGGKYWDGTGWVSDAVWFSVQMGNEEDPNSTQGTGKIISTKTLDMPFDSADGYVMTIDEPLSGEVELTIHAVLNDGGYGVLMLDNFKVDYFGEDLEQKKSDDSENRYAKTTGLNYTNEEVLSLRMATNNNNMAGYGLLSLYGESVEKVYFVRDGKDERPEVNLVNKGISLYGRNTEKLTLQLDKTGARPHDVILWNGKEYLMASEAVNWADESGNYILMEL